MGEQFDPYRKWLGIRPDDQPPHCYRLLGIPLYEDDPDVISNAADRQMAHLRTFQTGQHAALSQKLLNELSAAKVTLLDPEKKAAYDSELREKLQQASPPQAVVAPLEPPPAAVGRPSLQPSGPTPVPAAPREPMPASPSPSVATVSVAESTEEEDSDGINLSANRKGYKRSLRARKKNNAVPYVVFGSVAFILILVAIFFATRSSDDTSPKSGSNNKSKIKKQAPKPSTDSDRNKPNKKPKKKPKQPKTTDGNPKDNGNSKNQKKPDPKPSKPDKTIPKKPTEKEKPVTLDIAVKPNIKPSEGKNIPPEVKVRTKLQRQIRPKFGYSDDTLLRKSQAEIAELVKNLFDEAGKKDDDPAYKYTLLYEIKMIGIVTANIKVACIAIDSIASYFKVDALVSKQDAATRIYQRISSNYKKKPKLYYSKNTEVYQKAKQLLGVCLKYERYELAKSMASIGRNAAGRIKDSRARSLLEKTIDYITNLTALQKKFSDDLPKYKKDPTNKAACQNVGIFICVARSNWVDGCQLLTNSTDENVAATAKADLENPINDTKMFALAKKWSELAKSKSKAEKMTYLIRARYWFKNISSSASTLQKEQSIKEVNRINKLIGPDTITDSY